MKISKISISVLLLLLAFSFPVLAQVGPPPSGGSTSGPVDGGVISLLVGIVGYGYKKLKEEKKK